MSKLTSVITVIIITGSVITSILNIKRFARRISLFLKKWLRKFRNTDMVEELESKIKDRDITIQNLEAKIKAYEEKDKVPQNMPQPKHRSYKNWLGK